MAATENLKFLSFGLVLIATLCTQGVTAYDCPYDYPFSSCPRPILDSPDDTVCCFVDGYYDCCNEAILALWVVAVICCALVLVVVGLSVLVCCICPCCICAARRRQRAPVIIQTTGEVVGNQGGFVQPGNVTYQTFEK